MSIMVGKKTIVLILKSQFKYEYTIYFGIKRDFTATFIASFYIKFEYQKLSIIPISILY